MNEGLARWANSLSIVAALWLIFSPLWVSYSSTGNTWVQVVLGVVVGVLAVARMSTSARWPSSINFLAGIWFIVAPWVLASTTTDKWNQVVLGIIIVGLAALDLSASAASEEITASPRGLSSREASMGFGERIGPSDRDEDKTGRR